MEEAIEEATGSLKTGLIVVARAVYNVEHASLASNNRGNENFPLAPPCRFEQRKKCEKRLQTPKIFLSSKRASLARGRPPFSTTLSPQPSPSRESWRPLFRHAARKGSPLPMATTHMVPKETSEIGKNDFRWHSNHSYHTCHWHCLYKLQLFSFCFWFLRDTSFVLCSFLHIH